MAKLTNETVAGDWIWTHLTEGEDQGLAVEEGELTAIRIGRTRMIMMEIWG